MAELNSIKIDKQEDLMMQKITFSNIKGIKYEVKKMTSSDLNRLQITNLLFSGVCLHFFF